jgi:hypothetical protein
VPLRIAFDLDGVLADMESALLQQATILFGDAVARIEPPASDVDSSDASSRIGPLSAGGEAAADPTPPPLKIKLTARQQHKLWKHVQAIENFWETLQENEPGMVARLQAMASDRRWEVIFLTKRPQTAGRTAQVQTQRWLEARGFSLPSVFVVQGSRGRIAAALDLSIVVDDRPENCLDVVVDSEAKAILVWRQDDKPLPLLGQRMRIGALRSMNECLAALIEIDAQAAADPGIFERVLRLLGLNEPSQAT